MSQKSVRSILGLLWIQKTNHKMERIIRNSGVNWAGISGRGFSWRKIYGQRKYCQMVNGWQHFSYGLFPKTSLPQSAFWEKYLFPFGKGCQTMYPSRPGTLSCLVNKPLPNLVALTINRKQKFNNCIGKSQISQHDRDELHNTTQH